MNSIEEIEKENGDELIALFRLGLKDTAFFQHDSAGLRNLEKMVRENHNELHRKR